MASLFTYRCMAALSMLLARALSILRLSLLGQKMFGAVWPFKNL